MNQVHRQEIKSFEQLRERVRRLVELMEDPLPPEALDIVQEFLPEHDLPEKGTTGGD